MIDLKRVPGQKKHAGASIYVESASKCSRPRNGSRFQSGQIVNLQAKFSSIRKAKWTGNRFPDNAVVKRSPVEEVRPLTALVLC
jgi:hypothetical protein